MIRLSTNGGLKVGLTERPCLSAEQRLERDLCTAIFRLSEPHLRNRSSCGELSTAFWVRECVKGATAPFLCWVGLVVSRLLSKPVGLSSG